jgi:uncharacterized protein (TIGR00369 family)
MPQTFDCDYFNRLGKENLPGLLGIVFTGVGELSLTAELVVRPALMTPHGFLHGGTVVALADTVCGYACLANLPPGANSFTTIELKSNYFGTAREGIVECVASAIHMGRTTQVWDAVVRHQETQKTLAMFRCTQMILYPKP